MRTVRQFFERIIEWDWPDAPPRNPVIAGDIPNKPEPLPKFLDDRDAARLMAAARASADPRDRLVVELLARTGMRAGELADLEADAVVRIGAGHWLRIPLGKLRNDRYVPLHPELVELLASWTTANLEHIRRRKRLIADSRGSLDRHLIGRIVHRIGRAAGVPGVHPHRLRHTLATQAKVSGIASAASFGGSREHALPAAQRAARRPAWRAGAAGGVVTCDVSSWLHQAPGCAI
jgi:integrase